MSQDSVSPSHKRIEQKVRLTPEEARALEAMKDAAERQSIAPVSREDVARAGLQLYAEKVGVAWPRRKSSRRRGGAR